MNKRLTLSTLIVVLTLAGTAMPVLAQSDPLICDQFTDSPANVRVSYYMGEGMGYFASGSLAEALDSFSCVTDQIDSNYVPAYLSRAAVYAEYRSFDEALEDYDKAISLSPSSLPAYNNRGIVYAAMEEYDEALADFSQAISLDSSSVIALNNRAVIYALQGQYAAAITDLEQAISIAGLTDIIAQYRDPERDPEVPLPSVSRAQAQSLALLGVVYEMQARDRFDDYLLLLGGAADSRVQSAAGALQSRFEFELRLDDGTWLFAAAFSPAG